MTTIYGSETCGKCKILVKKYLNEQKDFEYIDVAELDREAIAELVLKYGAQLPIVVENA